MQCCSVDSNIATELYAGEQGPGSSGYFISEKLVGHTYCFIRL